MVVQRVFSVLSRGVQRWYVRVVVSVTLLFFVIRQVDVSAILQSIRQVPFSALALYLGILVVVAVLASWRWAWWLEPHDQTRLFSPLVTRLFLPLVRATAIGYLYSLLLPGTVGGDAVKWTNLLPLGLSKRRLIFSVILDRFSGLIGLILFGFISAVIMYMLGTVPLDTRILVVFGCLFAAVIVFFVLVFSPWYVSNLPMLRRWPILQTADVYLKSMRPAILATTAITIIIHFISCYALYVLAQGLNLEMSLWHFLVVGSITSLFLVLPISFSGFGLTEVSYLFFFTQLGATKEHILALTALVHSFKIVLAFLGWLYDFCWQWIDRVRLAKAVRHPDE